EWWAQDNWQTTPRLNINYGLRYTYNGRLHAVGDKPIAIFLPAAPGGLAVIGKDLDALYPADYNNFAPRLGFSFAPQRGGKWVIRGHYGIYYDIINGNLFIDNLACSDTTRAIFREPGGADPVISISNPDPVKVSPNQVLFVSVTSNTTFSAFT